MRGEEARQAPEEVLSRFPHLAEVIRRTYAADEPFRELCGDHAECVRMIERVRRADGEHDHRFEQYLELRIHLEHELLSRIGGPEEASHPASRFPAPDPAGEPAPQATPDDGPADPPPSSAKHPIKP